MLCHKEFRIKALLQNAFLVRVVFSIPFNCFFMHSKEEKTNWRQHFFVCFYAVGQITFTGNDVVKVYNLTVMSGSTTLATTQTPLSIHFVMLSINRKRKSKNFRNASHFFWRHFLSPSGFMKFNFIYILFIRTQL